jgi:hypothetical protein
VSSHPSAASLRRRLREERTHFWRVRLRRSTTGSQSGRISSRRGRSARRRKPLPRWTEIPPGTRRRAARVTPSCLASLSVSSRGFALQVTTSLKPRRPGASTTGDSASPSDDDASGDGSGITVEDGGGTRRRVSGAPVALQGISLGAGFSAGVSRFGAFLRGRHRSRLQRRGPASDSGAGA